MWKSRICHGRDEKFIKIYSEKMKETDLLENVEKLDHNNLLYLT